MSHLYSRIGFFTLALLTCLSAVAQVKMPTVSPAALSYGKYADIPVDQHTGTGDITVPLHTVTEGPLSLPIYLQYHTAGLQVGSPASSVGLGWNLNVGGMISRTVMGLPDDWTSNGYYHKGAELYYPTNQDAPVWNWDTQPDIFTYNFPGYTGKFFIDQNQTIQSIPKSDLNIKVVEADHNSGNHIFHEFIVTTPDGTVYRFGRSEEADNYAHDYVSYQADISTSKDRTGWHLVQIKSADKLHTINITYERVAHIYQTANVCPEEVKYRKSNGTIDTWSQCPPQKYQYYVVYSAIPKSIATTHETITFNTSSREDQTNGGASLPYLARKTNGLSIQNGAYCTQWSFIQSYFKSGSNPADSHGKRLKLDGVQKMSCSATGRISEPAWQFLYLGTKNSDNTVFFPSTTDKNIDHWGYYNKTSSSDNNPLGDITPPHTIDLAGNTSYGAANRNSDQTAMMQGMLNKVVYPTGGFLSIDYEANQYRKQQQSQYPVNISTSTTTTQNFQYTSAMSSGGWAISVNPDFGVPFGQSSGRVEVRTSGGTLVSQIEVNEGNLYNVTGNLPTIGFGSGNSPMIAGQTYRITVTATKATVQFTINYDPAPTNVTCGGLRIKKTTVNDGSGSTDKDIINTYQYVSNNDASISSGILNNPPVYMYRLSPCTAVFTAYSMAPLSSFNGYHIGYDRVVILKNGLGKIETIFNHDINNLPPVGYPYIPASFNVEEGVPKETSSYVEGSSTAVSKSTTQRYGGDNYTTFGNSSASGYIFATKSTYVYDGSSGGVKNLMTKYTIRTSAYRPSKVTTITDGLTSTVDYKYGANNLLPKEISVTNSNGDVHKTVYTYTVEHSDNTWKPKFNKYNIKNIPYKVEEYYNNVLVAGTETTFRFFKPDGTSPSSSTSGRIDVPRAYEQKALEKTYDASGTLTGSNTWKVKSTILAYNSNAFPALYRKDGWSTTQIKYNNKLPTEKIYSSHSEIYEYDPSGTALVKATTQDGTTTSYTYDVLGRLKTVTDDCNTIVSTYTYHFTTGGTDKNYTELKTDYPTPSTNSALDIVETRSYLDGLGRPIQTVAKKQGPSSNQDIISAQEYDKYGRIYRSYEPYAYSSNNGEYRTPSTSWGYTQTTYEISPISRVKSVTPPSWVATTFSYGVNTSSDAVKNLTTSQNYGAGLLTKHVTKDGNSNQLIIFTDRIGRKVLSRRTNSSDSASNRLDTYYLYDGKGRLWKVLPPGATMSTPNLIYTYLYDVEDQLSSKEVPGRTREEFKYNSKNLLAARQDGFLSGVNKWYVYSYDEYGREYNAGFRSGALPSDLNTITPDESLVQTGYGTNSYDWDKVTSVSTKIMDGLPGYLVTTNSYSTCGRLDQQTGSSHLLGNLESNVTTVYSYDGGHNVTGSTYTHRVASNTTTITSASFYDHVGRNTSNNFKVNSGVNRKINQLEYNYKDQLQTKYQGGTNLSGALAYLQKIDYTYLPNGMLQGINLNTDGKLSGTQVGLPTEGTVATAPSPATPSSSSYDDRDLFQLELYRNAQAPGIATSSFPVRNNGDIVAVATQVRGRKQQVWAAAYDNYDRLRTTAFYQRDSRSATATLYDNYKEDMTYDSRGNIKTLNREGATVVSGKYYRRALDRLTYVYDQQANNDISNKLIDVNESSSGSTTLGYKPGSSDYEYDGNGNMTRDPSRGITSIEYNHLDLPTKVIWGTAQRLEFIYDATGTLLNRKIITTNSQSVDVTQENRDYVGGIEYVGGTLESVQHGEGRIKFSGTTQEWQYVLTDHLGNTRLVYADKNGNGIAEVPSEIIQEEHYYPFGMKMTGPWMGGAAGAKMAYQYNGIEHVAAFDLNVNMATFRTLDPIIGRWWQVDPKAEAVKSHSPYVSMGNSPMLNSDPDGDLFFAIPQIGFSNGKLSVGLEVGVGIPGVLSASATVGGGGGGFYWSVQGYAAGVYAGYGSSGAFFGMGLSYGGFTAGVHVGAGGPSVGLGYGVNFGNGYAGSIGLSYGKGGFGYSVGASSTYMWGTVSPGATNSPGSLDAGPGGDQIVGNHGLYDDQTLAYNVMAEQTTTLGVETSGWVVDDGVLVSPVSTGDYTNTASFSGNSYYRVTAAGKKFFAYHNGERHAIRAQVHTHPSSDAGPYYWTKYSQLVGKGDYGFLRQFRGMSMYTIGPNKVHRGIYGSRATLYGSTSDLLSGKIGL